MFAPDDPLAPSAPPFAEPWHAQVLAVADTMIQAGHFSATSWAETLGAALREREMNGEDDTTDGYFAAALAALEKLSGEIEGLDPASQFQRKEAWKQAYLQTPHGSPVELSRNLKS